MFQHIRVYTRLMNKQAPLYFDDRNHNQFNNVRTIEKLQLRNSPIKSAFIIELDKWIWSHTKMVLPDHGLGYPYPFQKHSPTAFFSVHSSVIHRFRFVASTLIIFQRGNVSGIWKKLCLPRFALISLRSHQQVDPHSLSEKLLLLQTLHNANQPT